MLNIGAFARLGQVSPRMLRHYDQVGLLVPDAVDPDSGYRRYGVHQLGRLHRIVAHLRALDRSEAMELQDITIKRTQPLRVAQAAAGTVAYAEIGPAFTRLGSEVMTHLRAIDAMPGIGVGMYEYEHDDAGDEGQLTLRVGVDIGDQDVPDSGSVHVLALPATEVAASVFTGPVDA